MITAEQIKQVVSKYFGVPVQDLTDTTSFRYDLLADSLEFNDLCMQIDDDYGIPVLDILSKDKYNSQDITIGTLINMCQYGILV